jgi:DNA processing protein
LKHKIRIITIDSEEYPECLKKIDNPPSVLFAYGNLNSFKENSGIGIVGSRKPAEYSVNVTSHLATELSKLGFVIVSGFATGVDYTAHTSALNLHNPTVAVLGCGLEINYPTAHSNLKYRFAENGGAVISEYFPNTQTFSAFFPIRNRIISGLSNGVIVIEATPRSGSLITANHAAEQNRDVFCVPPADIFSPKYSGVIPLLRDGAIPVYSYLDVAKEYCSELLEESSFATPLPEKIKTPKSKSTENIEKTENKKEKTVNNKQEINWDELDETTAKVLKLVCEKEILIDEISYKLDIKVPDLLMIIMDLAVRGYVKKNVGGIISPV